MQASTAGRGTFAAEIDIENTHDCVERGLAVYPNSREGGLQILSGLANEQAHHMYLCARHMDNVMAAEYVTKRTGLLKCGCKQGWRIGASPTVWWKTVKLAKSSLARHRERVNHPREDPQAEISAENELQHLPCWNSRD
ncbi:hypothetical protein FN846DRAFT_892509 [Sphaerosporella brunnea]|uniref:Uncharacterized protein n=1 Tax=Sphaerosporella brunnea TaxID=1250544 RepID=A0A5J5EPQ0_9PEZI|nr:hypothetical protein FN846DRAFT_892509 [Sphaerosporella brunnea]